MTLQDFRSLAVGFANVKVEHDLGNERFSVHGVPIATIGSPDHRFAAVRLLPVDQAAFLASDPMVFSAAPGGAGQRGTTRIRLAQAELSVVKQALKAAYHRATNRTPPPRR